MGTINTGRYNTGSWNAGDWNTGGRNTGDRNTGDWNTGNRNTGSWNTGSWNTGDWNTGSRNMGSRNTGSCNTGDWNSGDCNTDSRNTGRYNTGSWNAGDWNTGDWNTGNRNTGSWNTGSWNTGDWNTGYFNTITPDDILVFNKPAKRSDWEEADKPEWIYDIYTTRWINESEMTEKEKEAYPSYIATGGYLKVCTSFHHACIEAWDRASKEDREKTFNLPNYDREIFKEIFGFYADAQSCNVKIVTIDGKQYKLQEVE